MKQAHVKLDKIIFQLDAQLDQCAKGMQIPFDERFMLDINNIGPYVEDIKERYGQLQAERDQLTQEYEEKVNELEKRMDICDQLRLKLNLKN